MQRLAEHDTLAVQQRKEWGEILTGFEGKNRYAVMDTLGNTLYAAIEEAGSLLARLFLKALRPFTILLTALDGTAVARFVRPFRFYFHELEVQAADGRPLGTIKRRFAIVRRKYDVVGSDGQVHFALFGPLLHPWTFNIMDPAGREHGKITKKWSGLLKEGFTDADNFGVVFPREWDVERKMVFLGAVFLIDFVHFENTGNS